MISWLYPALQAGIANVHRSVDWLYRTTMSDGWRAVALQRMAELGMNQAEFCRKTGYSKSVFRDLFHGRPTKGVRPSEPSVERARQIAHVLGLTLSTLFEGETASPSTITINGVVGGRGDMWVNIPIKSARAVPLSMLAGDVSVVLVDGEEHEPDYRRGDVLCGQHMIGKALDNIIGLDCIIETTDGERLLKCLMRGSRPGRYTLRSLRRGIGDIVDAKLKWAAPIQMILRGV